MSDKLAADIRAEADHLEQKHAAQHGSLPAGIVNAGQYIRGKVDGLRQAAELLSEGPKPPVELTQPDASLD